MSNLCNENAGDRNHQGLKRLKKSYIKLPRIYLVLIFVTISTYFSSFWKFYNLEFLEYPVYILITAIVVLLSAISMIFHAGNIIIPVKIIPLTTKISEWFSDRIRTNYYVWKTDNKKNNYKSYLNILPTYFINSDKSLKWKNDKSIVTLTGVAKRSYITGSNIRLLVEALVMFRILITG